MTPNNPQRRGRGRNALFSPTFGTIRTDSSYLCTKAISFSSRAIQSLLRFASPSGHSSAEFHAERRGTDAYQSTDRDFLESKDPAVPHKYCAALWHTYPY